MPNIAKRAALPVAALLMASLLAQPADAAALAPAHVSQLARPPSHVTQVYWRRGWGWGWPGRWWGPGPAIAGGILIGGALVASAIAEHRATDAAVRRCEDDFPSFDPRTGTFRNRYGERRICPYLY